MPYTAKQQAELRARRADSAQKLEQLQKDIDSGKLRINDSSGFSPLQALKKVRQRIRDQFERRAIGYKGHTVLGSKVVDPSKDLLKSRKKDQNS